MGFAIGEEHCNAKLTEEQVRYIKRQWELIPRRCLNGLQTALGIKFGVSQMCIWRILTDRTWTHVTANIEENAKCDTELLKLLLELKKDRVENSTLRRNGHRSKLGSTRRR